MNQVELCSICYHRKVTAETDSCPHQFCNTCIKDWVKRTNQTCPMCRVDIYTIISIRTKKVLFRVKRQKQKERQVPRRQQIQLEQANQYQEYYQEHQQYQQAQEYQELRIRFRSNAQKQKEKKKSNFWIWVIVILFLAFIFK